MLGSALRTVILSGQADAPGALLAFDFQKGVYRFGGASGPLSAIPGWAFSRSTPGQAQRVDGSWVAFAAGAPRITDKGLLVEEARTNLFLNSAAPVTQTLTLGVGSYVLTAWGGSGSVTAAAGTAVGSNFGAVSATAAGASRVLTIATGGTVALTVAGLPLFVQVEAGAWPTSPILTGGTATLRAADSAEVTGLSFSGTVTLFAEAMQPVLFSSSRNSASLNGGTNQNMANIYRQSGGTLNGFTAKAGVSVALVGSAASAGVYWKQALRTTGAEIAYSVNGGALIRNSNTANIQSPSVLTRLTFGNESAATGAWLCGYVRRVQLYRDVSDIRLQELTA